MNLLLCKYTCNHQSNKGYKTYITSDSKPLILSLCFLTIFHPYTTSIMMLSTNKFSTF